MNHRDNVRALIIEKVPERAELLERVLQEGYAVDVRTAADSDSARELIASEGFDIVTLAHDMDDELLDLIAGSAGNPTVIVVADSEERLSPGIRKRASGCIIAEHGSPTLNYAVEKALAEATLKRTEAALRDERDLTDAALNSIPDSFFILDLKGEAPGSRGFRWNRRVSEATGYTDEEIRNMTPADFFKGEDLNKVTAAMEQVARTGRASVEVMLTTKDGRRIPYEYTAALLRDSAGEPIGIAGTGRDISERKRYEEELAAYRQTLEKMVRAKTEELEKANELLVQEVAERERAEAALRKSEAFWKAIIERSSDVLSVFDEDGTLIFLNPGALELLGYSPGELLGEKVFRLIHPDDIQEILDNHRAVLETPGLTRMSMARFKAKDGTWRVLEAVGRSFTDTSGALRVVVNTRDITDRKAVEEELRESKDILRSFFDASLDAAFLVEPDGTVVIANKQLARRLGASVDRIEGSVLFDWLPEGHAAKIRRMLQEVFNTEEPLRFTDGLNGRITEQSLSPVRGQGGRVERVAVVSSDITAQKLAEDELLKFKAIADTANYGVVIYDMDGAFTYVNHYFAAINGYEPEELIGLSREALHTEEQMEEVKRSWSEVTLTGSVGPVEVWHRHREGFNFPMLMYGTLFTDDSGRGLFVTETSIDITDRKQSEMAIKESEARYRSLFETSSDFIYIVGPDGMILDANRALLERVGMGLEEMRNTHFKEYLAGDNAREVHEAFERLNRGEEVRGLVVKAGGPSGEVFTYEINASPMVSAGEVVGHLNIARDITDRKKAEAELIRLNRELEGYAHTVSHDLRGPLTSIKLAAENLHRLTKRRLGGPDAELDRFAEVIALSVDKAEGIIEELLALARASQEPETVSLVDVSATVAGIIDEKRAEIDCRGARIEADHDLGRVKASPTHIYQIFSNLIGNAITHNKSAKPVVRVRYFGCEEGIHRYLISDNGPGIPEQDLSNIFMPFFSGEKGTTGIGLATVSKTIAIYGGEIRAYNRDGACFEFTIRDKARPPRKE